MILPGYPNLFPGWGVKGLDVPDIYSGKESELNARVDALKDNIVLDDAHNHDGLTSPSISSGAVVKPSKVTALQASWGATIGNGLYKQTLACPTPFLYENLRFEARVGVGYTGAGNIMFPTIEKVTANTFDVITNDNTISVEIYFS